ncbi:MAG: phenylacetate--CoA ligase family protein [Candidatus Dormibacteraeota bacterium]|nr:phenylacetate--CoA ligase family protein [Candidatus Dormibacteraeota bacterium]
MPRSSSSSPASLDEIRAEQLRRLRLGLPEVLRQNRFWRERLHDVRGWDDFERLPLLTKDELVRDQAATPPFGTNLTRPLAQFIRLHQTSGSSGAQPLRWLDTPESWAWWVRIWADHVYAAAGVTAADRVFLAFSFGPFIGFWSAFGGAAEVGALTISGGAMGSEQRLRTIADLGATVLLCTPTYALRLAESARDLGLDAAALPLRVTIHAGEPGASIPATRTAIEDAFAATAFDHTGMTELGPTGHSCAQRDGVHLIESEFIFETLPSGELVATNLGRWGMPLFRYRTGDRVELSREPCSCGSAFVKVRGGVQGRVDDMFTVRGVNVFPSQVEDVIRRRPGITEFQIQLGRVRGLDEATLLVEGEGAEAALARLGADLRQALGVRLECRAVGAGTLPRPEMKARRLVKLDV